MLAQEDTVRTSNLITLNTSASPPSYVMFHQCEVFIVCSNVLHGAWHGGS
jgi:hypothetical protein